MVIPRALDNRVAGAVLLALAILLVYSINLDRLPHNDELYHMLAAKGLLETGEPAIGENGRYWRGYPLTWLVAQSIDLLGPGLPAGRLPAVLLMTAGVVVLFLFVWGAAGRLAAWLTTLLFALSPFAIDIAQFVRFYSLQCLVFLIGAWAVYGLMRDPWPPWRGLLLAALALAAFAFATYLQPTTLIGILGIGTWMALAILVPWLVRPSVPPRRKLAVIGALVAGGLLVLAALWAAGVLAPALETYRATPLFNTHLRNVYWFYFQWYFLYYPTLWTSIGILAALALTVQPRLAGFAITVFGVSFVLSSFAGPKSLRYIVYAQPFLFIIWGLGLAGLIGWLRGRFGPLRAALTRAFALLPEAAAHRLAGILLVIAVALTALANPAWVRSAAMLAGITLPGEISPTDWAAAEPYLRPALDSADILVTTEELAPLYYYGRADLLLSATRFRELMDPDRPPFSADPRTGVPTIDEAADLVRVIDCYPNGLLLTQAKHWGPGARLRDAEVEALLREHAEPLPLPPRTALLAFTWTHPDGAGRARSCPSLPLLEEGLEEGLGDGP